MNIKVKYIVYISLEAEDGHRKIDEEKRLCEKH